MARDHAFGTLSAVRDESLAIVYQLLERQHVTQKVLQPALHLHPSDVIILSLVSSRLFFVCLFIFIPSPPFHPSTIYPL